MNRKNKVSPKTKKLLGLPSADYGEFPAITPDTLDVLRVMILDLPPIGHTEQQIRKYAALSGLTEEVISDLKRKIIMGH